MTDTSTTRFGLILGAGGAFGWPFHLGVLHGLEQATGLRIHDATRVVGTSSGAAIGAATLTGREPVDILATMTAGPDDATKAEMRASFANARKPWRWLRPQAPRLLRSALNNPVAAGVGLLPAGFFPTTPLRRFVDSETLDWPGSLWIPAVALDTGNAVVFGRDVHHVSLRDAIEATAAVPLMMRPKHIDGVFHVDGAVDSATHGDLLDGADFDLVVVSSPMTRPGRGPVKIRARRQLADEVTALQRQGAKVVVIEPDERVMDTADGFPRSKPDAGHAIIDAATRLTFDALT